MTTAKDPAMASSSSQQDHWLNVTSYGRIRVAVVGNVDAGKSTLIGTCVSGKLDDGNGSSRAEITRLKHEAETGRTSSISTHLMALDQQGNLITVPSSQTKYREAAIFKKGPENIYRTISLMDLAGHERYFRTTIAGLSRGMADYALVLVNASQAPTHMTLHHLNLCQMCGIPVIVVLTKVDSCPANVFRQTKIRTFEALRSPSIGKKHYTVKNFKDVETVKDKLHALVPVLEISCVTGEGLHVLQKLLMELPKRRNHETKRDRPFEFLVEEMFNVAGVGTVLSGFVNAGQWKKGDHLYVGPFKDGSYMKATARSVHVNQIDVNQVWAGHSACFALGSLTKEDRKKIQTRVRKMHGLVLLKEPHPPVTCCTADICFLKGESVTMSKGSWQSTAHILHLRTSVQLVDIEHVYTKDLQHEGKQVLRPGHRAQVKLRFLHGPVHVRKGMRVILRDGHVRGIGIIGNVEVVKS